MKKAILAVLIPTLLAGASSVSAYDFIKNDDMKFNVNGDIDLKTTYSDKDSGTSTTTTVNFDDVDFDLEWYSSDDVKFIAALDFTSETKNDDYEDDELYQQGFFASDEAWVGVDSKTYGKFTAGSVLLPFDGFGIDTSETYGGQASSYTDGNATKAKEGFIYAYQAGDIELSAAYGKPGDDKAEDEVMQVKALYKAGDIEATFGVSSTTEFDDKEEVTKVTAIQADYAQSFGDVKVGVLAGYESVDFTGASSGVEDFTTTGIEFDVAYKLTSTVLLSTGVDYVTQDIDGQDDLVDFFVAAKFTLAKNVYLLTELAQIQGDLTTFSNGALNPKYSESTDETKGLVYLNLQF